MYPGNSVDQDLELNEVLEQMYDADNEIPISNSKYFDVDELQSITGTTNFSTCEFSCMHINIRSLPNKLNKLDIFINNLRSENIGIDFLLLCETFLNNTNHDMYTLEGYKFVGKHRQIAKCGGVGIFIKNGISYKVREDLSIFVEREFESIFIEVSFGNSHVVIGEVYRVPGTDCNIAVQRYSDIVTRLQNEHKQVVIGTDQNINLLDDNFQYSRLLLDSFYSAGMLPTITRPTRVTHNSATLIDNLYVMSNQLDHITSGIITLDISDHFPVFVLVGTKQTPKGKPLEVKHRKIDDSAITNLKSLLLNTDWSYLNHLLIDDQFDALVKMITEYLDICAPLKIVKIPYAYAKRNNWMTKGLLKSSRVMSKLRKEMMGKPTCHDSTLKYNRYRNFYNRLIKVARSTYYGNLFENCKGDISATWRTLNELIGKSHDKTSCTSMNIDGRRTSDPNILSNKFCEYFTNIGRECASRIPAAQTPYTHYLRVSHNRSLFLDPVTPGDVIAILGHMKSKTSTGNDNLSSKLLKSIRGEIAYPLSVVINNSLVNGIVPDTLKIAKVIPLYKAKDQQSLTNYRPISLLPVMSKVLEKVVYVKLSKFLETENILFPSQYGFRKHHSTIHGVVEFIQHTVQSYDNKSNTLSVLLDLSKAFDTIDHNILLYKLKYYGVRGTALKWFQSYLFNRRQFVCFNGTKSDVKEITFGVPQGSVLGPILFLVYMNDLPNCLSYTKAILFADDTTLYASSDDIIHLYANVNHDLQSLVDWFRANKLSLNPSKTNYMLFSPHKTDHSEHSIKIGSDIIEQKNYCKFLGLVIDDKLTWSEHIAHTMSKLSRSLYALNRTKHIISRSHRKTLYDSLVHSYISYGIVLWGSTYSSNLQKIRICQKKALRCIYGSVYNAHTDPLFRDSKILKFDDLYQLEVGKLIYDALHEFLPKPLIHVFKPNTTVHAHHTRQKDNPHIHVRRTVVAKNSLVHRAPQIWSKIPMNIREKTTRNIFKRTLKKSLLFEY